VKNTIITVLVVLLPCVIAVGFCRGWFAELRRNPDAGRKEAKLTLTVAPDETKKFAEAVR
jgi:hypothetical protein